MSFVMEYLFPAVLIVWGTLFIILAFRWLVERGLREQIVKIFDRPEVLGNGVIMSKALAAMNLIKEGKHLRACPLIHDIIKEMDKK